MNKDYDTGKYIIIKVTNGLADEVCDKIGLNGDAWHQATVNVASKPLRKYDFALSEAAWMAECEIQKLRRTMDISPNCKLNHDLFDGTTHVIGCDVYSSADNDILEQCYPLICYYCVPYPY